jgi:predicted MFS family arabinose efflux permease
MLIAVVMLAISNSARPERLGGFFLSVSGPPSLILAYMLPTVLNQWLGWNVGFTVMAGIGVLCAAAGAAYTQKFAPARAESRTKFVWTRSIFLALAATLLANAAFGACFTYAEPLARLRGIADERVAEIMSLAIGCMIAGSLAVALSGRFFRALPFMAGAAILQIAAILLVLTASSDLQFAIGLGTMCFLWQGSAPCAIALVAALDETRATAPLSFPLQLVGLSIGPLVAAPWASSSLSNPYFIGLALYGSAAFLLVMVGQSSRSVRNLRV